MKWVIRGTSVLAFIFAVVQLIRMVSDGRERRRHIDELLRVEQMQSQAGDYAAGWASLEKALHTAESGGLFAKLTGQLSPDAQRVRTAQENLAMAWVQNLQVAAGEKYSPIADRLSPVLMRGAAASNGQRKADLLAHTGWAAFYKSLDGAAVSDLAPQYRAALTEDGTNPYAHAFLGHWIVWSGGSLDEAMAEFTAAVAANRARPFVRRVERAALRRRGQTADGVLVSVVTDMRQNGETIDASLRSDVDAVYYFACGVGDNADRMRALLTVVPAHEQVVTYRRLFYDRAGRSLEPSTQRDACLATLLEAAGQREDALHVWRRIRSEIGAAPHALKPRTEAAIKRLRGA
jgi:hypothetical protein